MKTKTDKALTLMMTACFMLSMYIGYTGLDEFGVGYLWLGLYTIGAYGLAYQVFKYFVNESTN